MTTLGLVKTLRTGIVYRFDMKTCRVNYMLDSAILLA
jgi:hypothetical protein